MDKLAIVDEEPIVYMIGSVQSWTPVKIGFTRGGEAGVNGRLASIQTGNPTSLEVLRWFGPATIEDEQAIHAYFEGARMRGEWFDPRKAHMLERMARGRLVGWDQSIRWWRQIHGVVEEGGAHLVCSLDREAEAEALASLTAMGE